MMRRPVAPGEIARIRDHYATGLFDQRSIGEDFRRSKGFVGNAVAGMPRPIGLPPRNMREPKGPPRPDNQPRPAVLRLCDVQPNGRRRWWPSVPEHCSACGGRLSVVPPSYEPGYVTCDVCCREFWEVR